MTTTNTDVVILGGGHNGLVCAFYLARAGLEVTVLERRHVVGGAAVTEEFHPGFRNSTASYTVSLLNPKVIADMDLARHGLTVVERKVSNFLPFEDGRYFLAGEGRTQGELAKFSARDAARLPDYEARLEVVAAVLRDWILKAPPNMVEGGWMAMLPELLKGASLGKQAAGLDVTGRRDLLDLFAKSAGDWLDGWFESDPIKALFGFDSVVGARAVVSNLHPRLLFERFVDDAVVPGDFRERIGNYQSGSGTFRMNVALSELPDFTALPGQGDHLTAGVIIAPSLAYMDRAHAEARLNGWSSKPIVEMLIPSTLDDTLAPPGQHVASLFCQHVDPTLGDEHRDTVADLMIDTVDAHAPGFRASVLGRLALGPRDLERRFGLVGGDIFHGRLSLDQLFSARPVLGHAGHRMPVPGLYLCGSGAHPGGGVTGAPGHNAARAVLKDMRQ